MIRQGITHFAATTRYKVYNTFRETSAMECFRQIVRSQRRVLTRFQYDRVAHEHSRDNLLHNLTQRIVPRRNARYNANRVTIYRRLR